MHHVSPGRGVSLTHGYNQGGEIKKKYDGYNQGDNTKQINGDFSFIHRNTLYRFYRNYIGGNCIPWLCEDAMLPGFGTELN